MTEQEQAWARKAEAELELSRKIKKYGSMQPISRADQELARRQNRSLPQVLKEGALKLPSKLVDLAEDTDDYKARVRSQFPKSYAQSGQDIAKLMGDPEGVVRNVIGMVKDEYDSYDDPTEYLLDVAQRAGYTLKEIITSPEALADVLSLAGFRKATKKILSKTSADEWGLTAQATSNLLNKDYSEHPTREGFTEELRRIPEEYRAARERASGEDRITAPVSRYMDRRAEELDSDPYFREKKQAEDDVLEALLKATGGVEAAMRYLENLRSGGARTVMRKAREVIDRIGLPTTPRPYEGSIQGSSDL
jgi:hypothetical protein